MVKAFLIILLIFVVVYANQLTVSGKVINFECGDNCYIDVLNENGVSITVMVPWEGFSGLLKAGQTNIGKYIKLNYKREFVFNPNAGDEIILVH
jgi:hypothetical protein